MNWLKELKNNFNILDIKFEKVETYCESFYLRCQQGHTEYINFWKVVWRHYKILSWDSFYIEDEDLLIK
jgi:hypothetical protein